MTTPNHIAGGLVFTGTMLSFYNLNLFASPFYLAACISFSILADIDTPQTLPGKTVYPIAVYINRKFGHRTLTHSLLFLCFSWLFLAFLGRLFSFNEIYPKIFLFAFTSHLILDMLTIQGVPLFYPFRRNPCVLPADPAYRLTTTNVKSEIIVFTVFVLLAFTMFPLFNQGFWTAYNRQFATITHCNRENSKASNWVICEYEYIKNNITINGEAFIISSSDKKLELFNSKEVFELDQDDPTLKIVNTKPKLSQLPKKYQEINFMNIAIDSVNNLMANKICTGLIQSNKTVNYNDKGITYNTNFLKFANSFNFRVLESIDSTKTDIIQKLKIVDARIKKDSLQQLSKHTEYNQLLKKEKELRQKIDSLNAENLYIKNRLQNELIDIANKIKNMSFEIKNIEIDIVLLRERENLVNQLNKQDNLLFSGYLTYCIFDK